MCQVNGNAQSPEEGTKKPAWWKLRLFWAVILADLILSLLFELPVFDKLRDVEGEEMDHYTLSRTLWDLMAFTCLRFVTAAFALISCYYSDVVPPETPFDPYHKNGEKKTREDLEHEALEEPLSSWVTRYILRPAFPCELATMFSGLFLIAKCFARLNVELGAFASQGPDHPVFWIILLFSMVFSVIEASYTDSISTLAGECGRSHRAEIGTTGSTWIRRIGSNLSIPLLAGGGGAAANESNDGPTANGEEGGADATADGTSDEKPEEVRGSSDITSDAHYKATFRDLLATIYPDAHFVAAAFVFLLLAATAQIYIPRYTGEILDSLSAEFAGSDGKDRSDIPIWKVPGFIDNVRNLMIASIFCGIFSGLRGSIFTMVGGRVNIRLRTQLMDALLAQDIGFFDVTKTGDITSRLSSDTTLVGDQVTFNVNVFLRSLVQVIGVLIFMFLTSWQLSLLAFISVPILTILSKWYGEFVRKLSKLMQKKLADGNAVSEAAMGSMSTVRAFDAAEIELNEFRKIMDKYLDLNFRSSVAYFFFCICLVAQPNMVTAIVLFYGGLLVRNGAMTSGKLVSFLLYLQSLSDGFGGIGYIFSSLTSAVGAADKVFELMNRKPKLTVPSTTSEIPPSSRGTLGNVAMKTNQQRYAGTSPQSCTGEVTLNNVEMYYPARPQRRILDDLSLTVPPGSVVALVGPSGSGKSSVMSLVQHLYEPSSGQVLIDGQNVNELSPMWLSRNVSVVSQEPTLFARSVHRNIMYGLEGTDDEPSLEEVREAAVLANAHSFIEKLPLGYETDVGERGVQLSGGQKQRIAIARALVRKPRILLLDEATSALDAESEALVQEAIDDMLARGRGDQAGSTHPMTVLIVAHRLSTVRNADTIFVIQDGKVVEQGNHDELIRSPDGAYSSLIKRQMKAQMKLEG